MGNVDHHYIHIRRPDMITPHTQAAASAALLFAILAVGGAKATAGEQPPAMHPMVGKEFIPTDVDFAHPVYETSFEDPAVLKDWKLEGGKSMSVAGGNLVLQSHPSEDQSGRSRNHLVCWLKKEVPADFLLEFTVRPDDRTTGLNIVFFNARGTGGENIFNPPIKPRDGTFKQYHSGDLNNYHVSYWAGDRGFANLRKNKGFHLVAGGKDLVAAAKPGVFQTVRIYKRGGNIRVMVNDIVALAFDDDGKKFGPVHTHSGWIGLRQMGHTLHCEYGHVKVWPLKKTGSTN